MEYFVYILHSSSSDKYYVGSSVNPHRRLVFHNSIEIGFTSRFRPWKLLFTKVFENKLQAQLAERKIKSWKSRKMIVKLLNGEINI